MSFWFVIVPIILVIASDAYINSCYKKYSNTNVNSRISVLMLRERYWMRII